MVGSKPNSPVYLLLSSAIAMVIVAVSFLGVYEPIELKLLDLRFRLRGPMPTRSDIATVDIDVRALEEEGRFQDWTRDKHAEIIRFGQAQGVKMLAFDIYFPEPSTAHILARELKSLADEEVNAKTVHALVRDYDADMKEAIVEAGNVYLAQSFKTLDPERVPFVRPRSDRQNEGLESLAPFYQEFGGRSIKSLLSFFDIEPPILDFINVAKGVGFAQAVSDGDGVIRRYPLVGIYDNGLFPSIVLLMACDYLGVSFQDVKIVPGRYILLPSPREDDDPDASVRIPISEEGYMMVNWAGDWKDDFEHYPYTLVKNFSQAEHRNIILSRIKALLHETPDLIKDFRAFDAKVDSLGLKSPELARDALFRILQADRIESILQSNPGLSGEEFFKSQGIPVERISQGMMEFYQEIKTNLALKESLVADMNLHYDSLRSSLNLADTPGLRRNFSIIQNLLRSEGSTQRHHPLYFYPSTTEFTHQERLITPFEFKNKILFYGLTATGTHDLNPMPFSPRYPMVGLHANALNTILSGAFIERQPKIFEAILMLILGVILGLIVPRFHPLAGAAVTVLLWTGYAFGDLLAFTRKGLWVDVTGPSIIFLVGYVGITLYNYVSQEKDKKFLHQTFKAYLSPELIDKMYQERQSPQLGGEERILTAVFTDVQSFSTIAEELGSPARLVELLNVYLTVMTDILLEHHGTLDKYEGDAILAFFGAPVPMEDHAEKACRTALAMQNKLSELRKQWASDGNTWPQIVKDMLMRIGINSGPIVTGNMGSRTRMNYTMMGDAVNVAARLESMGKQYGVYTVCSGETLKLAGQNHFETRLVDRIRVVGKTEPVEMYELMGLHGDVDPQILEMRDIFQEAHRHYIQRDWDFALQLFGKSLELEPYELNPAVSTTTPSRVFIQRCEKLLKTAPGKDWDGVFTAISK